MEVREAIGNNQSQGETWGNRKAGYMAERVNENERNQENK